MAILLNLVNRLRSMKLTMEQLEQAHYDTWIVYNVTLAKMKIKYQSAMPGLKVSLDCI